MLLKLSGGGNFSIENNKIICEAGFTVEEDRPDVLSLKGPSTSISSSMSMSGYNFFSSVSSTEINSPPNQDLKINGITYKPKAVGGHHFFIPSIPGITVITPFSTGKEVDEPASKKNPTSHALDFSKVSGITIAGSAGLTINQDPPANLHINISGSGEVLSSEKTKHASTCKVMSLNVSGSGAVSLDWDVKSISINLAGSGCVKKIRAWKSVDVNACGSGSVKIYAEKSARITKSSLCTSSIKIVPV